MVRTRLDSVVAVKERVEDRAGAALARAESAVEAAKQRADAARQVAGQDHRARADASTWDMTELAHRRALQDAQKAEAEVATLRKSANVVRAQYVTAHQAAEVVRRVATTRREELQRDLDRRESKDLDEAAALLFVRKAG